MLSLSDLPVELLLDHICPLLPIQDLLSLSSTSHSFHNLIADETFWHRKLEEDFNFSGSETARTHGWQFLYQRLSNPRLFVWGENSSGRLGLGDAGRSLQPGAPYPVELRIPGARIVSLVAGGMSFHALDSNGNIHVWGTLDGNSGMLWSNGFSVAARRADRPMRLNLPAKFRSISCGRLHSAALDTTSHVWAFTSWGRPFRLVSPLLDKSSPEATPTQISSGWGFSSVLTESGDVFVYWPFSGRLQQVINEKNMELDEGGISESTRATPTKAEPTVIPCYPWDLQDVDPVRLPSIPTRLPRLQSTGLSDEELDAETKLVKIAGMDRMIIGLTNKGHVLRYGDLGGEDSYQRGHWEYLAEFSDVEKVRMHRLYSGPPAEDPSSERPRIEPPETMHITHITAQYKTFVAYSTGSRSVVLMGKFPSDGAAPSPSAPLQPTIIAGLQNRSVISVVLGDYHHGALTSTGKLLTWGAFSKGALGLGDPVKIAIGQPGGFATEQQRVRARRHMPHEHPPYVGTPTEVRFDHTEKKRRERYCFAAAAAGWHMGALVIDLERDEEEDNEDPSSEIPGAFPVEDVNVVPPPPPDALQAPGEYPMLPFGRGALRLGFAARGMFRGRGTGRGRGG
ncbi:uncharacterized protein FIBRA_05452 [Fibroporia radiculosa]|uniref:F-box domain-containing protein n=1 Tax=Fibroporia radiculosa TaxID=599839 RepID=J4H3I3_9APHY|nr:uncharacterized protein FIBRA_05452 [Fibroporia radiculosa]CCM03324.1 predicted protein [Fibroporia radiculosa]